MRINLTSKIFEQIFETLYPHLCEGAVREAGRAGTAFAKAVNFVGLGPIHALAWFSDQFRENVLPRIEASLRQRLDRIPESRLQAPCARVAREIIDDLPVHGTTDTVREMYVKLLATSMDSDAAKHAHPAFPAIVRQLTSDEARIVRYLAQFRLAPVITVNVGSASEVFSQPVRYHSYLGEEAGCSLPAKAQAYLDNLSRLGLISVIMGQKVVSGPHDGYERLVTSPEVSRLRDSLRKRPQQPQMWVEHGFVRLTAFGQDFCTACVDLPAFPRSESRRLERLQFDSPTVSKT